jgi:hypothetical protein
LAGFSVIFGQFRGVWPGLTGFSVISGWFPGVWPGFQWFSVIFGVSDRGWPGFRSFLAGFLVFGQVFDHFWLVFEMFTTKLNKHNKPQTPKQNNK